MINILGAGSQYSATEKAASSLAQVRDGREEGLLRWMMSGLGTTLGTQGLLCVFLFFLVLLVSITTLGRMQMPQEQRTTRRVQINHLTIFTSLKSICGGHHAGGQLYIHGKGPWRDFLFKAVPGAPKPYFHEGGK